MRNVSDVSILTISLMVLLSTYAGFVSNVTLHDEDYLDIVSTRSSNQTNFNNTSLNPWDWFTFDSGTGISIFENFEISASGDIYATGVLYGGSLSYSGCNESNPLMNGKIIIMKLDSTGSCKWITSINNSYSPQIGIDNQGRIFVSGVTSSNISIGATELQINSTSNSILFLAEITQNGVWTDVYTTLGVGLGVSGIDFDSDNDIYLTGTFGGIAYFNDDIYVNGDYYSTGVNKAMFLAKFDSSNNEFVWVEQNANTFGDVYSEDLVINSQGEIYITGTFYEYISFIGYTTYFGDSQPSVYIAKFSEHGYLMNVHLIQCGYCQSRSIALDSNQNVYITGEFKENIDNGSSNIQIYPYYENIFVAKLDPTISSIFWVTTGGGEAVATAWDISIDSDDTLLIGGNTDSNSTFGQKSILSPPLFSGSPFIGRMDTNGNWEGVFRDVGSNHQIDEIRSIQTSQSGDIFYAGRISGPSNFPGHEVNITDGYGRNKAFLVKFNDFDFDQINDNFDDCIEGMIGWSSSNESDYDSDGCEDLIEDIDDDNDGISDNLDTCQKGVKDWQSDQESDFDNDGCRDYDEDLDDDGDGIFDSSDSCLYTNSSLWGLIDYDLDGCNDDYEDDDDDNDGVIDEHDFCSKGELDWDSTQSSDHDSDGCKDNTEDEDNDNDGILQGVDRCPKGELFWTSNESNDLDNDGCKDSTEDEDDDNDGVSDSNDKFPMDPLEYKDTDGDGIGDNSDEDDDGDGWPDSNDVFPEDSTEYADFENDGYGDNADSDDDNDGVLDVNDLCPKGIIEWQSDNNSDYDGDGCIDSMEDEDDDNDDVFDTIDNCSKGQLDWTSSKQTDNDGDGCQDLSEDDDDDNDGLFDELDRCRSGEINWTSGIDTDHDADGCQDNSEDQDDDDDSISDVDDLCEKGELGWNSTALTDHDRDGCRDLSEDLDDDNDGLVDQIDDCSIGDLNWTSISSTDFDTDGCQDALEDLDDDGDGILDADDLCPQGQLGWVSTSALDYDSDGCHDANEDADDDNDGVLDAIELQAGTNPYDANSMPIESFSMVVGNVELSAWDLIGIILGTLTSGFLAFAFITRNGRFEDFIIQIKGAEYHELDRLEKKLELASFFQIIVTSTIN